MRVFSPCPTRLHTPNAAMIAAQFAVPLSEFCSTLFAKPKLQEFTAVRDKILYSSCFDSVSVVRVTFTDSEPYPSETSVGKMK